MLERQFSAVCSIFSSWPLIQKPYRNVLYVYAGSRVFIDEASACVGLDFTYLRFHPLYFSPSNNRCVPTMFRQVPIVSRFENVVELTAFIFHRICTSILEVTIFFMICIFTNGLAFKGFPRNTNKGTLLHYILYIVVGF